MPCAYEIDQMATLCSLFIFCFYELWMTHSSFILQIFLYLILLVKLCHLGNIDTVS